MHDRVIWVPRTLEDAEDNLRRKEAAVEGHNAMIARRLRGWADKIENGSIDPIYELMWGTANLNLDMLARLRAEREFARGVVAKYQYDAEKAV
jgi:hypothetical protein